MRICVTFLNPRRIQEQAIERFILLRGQFQYDQALRSFFNFPNSPANWITHSRKVGRMAPGATLPGHLDSQLRTTRLKPSSLLSKFSKIRTENFAYTISQDRTAGDAAHRSTLLASFPKKCVRKQLKIATVSGSTVGAKRGIRSSGSGVPQRLPRQNLESVSDIPVKYTPVTGRIIRTKKGVPVHTCDICRPAKSFARAEHLR